MHIYFAQFLPAEGRPGTYCVSFPDLPGCDTFGESLPEALFNARECLTSYLEASVALNEAIPEPSPVEVAQEKAEEECRELGIAIPDGTFYQAVQSDPLDEKPIQVSVSMLPSLVQAVDNAAREAGMTRSGFLAYAARRCAQEMAAR